ncbi:MAG: hypothetical protein WBE46_01225 [Dehalococcoidia bacterium]
MWQKKIFASAILLVALMMAFPAVGLLAGESSTDTMDLSTRESSILEAYGKLPLLFIENRGQVDEAVRYYVKASGQTVYFTEENIVFDLICSDLAEADDRADFEEVPSVQYDLSINSTEFGSVTTPGEGMFNYTAGMVVDLEATPDAGYRFDRWTGDVGTIADVNAAATTITMEDDYSITANFVGVEAGDVGIKAGDWIKLKYTFSGWPAGQTYPEWLKLEFLTVEGTIATVRFTQHISDGTEQSDTAPVDVVSNIEVPMLAGIVISANLTTGDSVYIAGHGNVSIEDEAIKAYAGADRTVVYASFSQNETQVTYYWDKLTGVMVEVSSIYPGFTATAKAAETNMWEATTVRMPWWPWIIVAVVAVGLVIFFVRRRRAA